MCKYNTDNCKSVRKKTKLKFDYVRKCINFTAFLIKEKSFCVDDFIDDDEDYAANAHMQTHIHIQRAHCVPCVCSRLC